MKILRPEDKVCEILEYEKKRPRIISVVGAGGKTTLIYRLAEELKRKGLRVLITTTTKMYVPKRRFISWESGIGEEGDKGKQESAKQMEEKIRVKLHEEGIVVVGRILNGEEKFTGISEKVRSILPNLCDVLLVEADGARQKPVKVPAEHEPVLFPASDLVIGVLGMNSVGQRILKAAHRPEDVAAFLNTSVKHRITEEDLEKIAESPLGLKKGVDCEFEAVGNVYESKLL